MIRIRNADERGRTRLSWLDGRHSFSFGQYRDPDWNGFRSLLVLNDDVIEPSGGFGTHPHADMEIITWVIEGTLAHRDSEGNAGEVRPGEVQKMSAGTGILHSEVNPSPTERVRLLQIWIVPERRGLKPGYQEERVPKEPGLTLVAGPPDTGAKITIHQDAKLYVGRLESGAGAEVALAENRHAWLQVATGSLTLNGHRLAEGDGAQVSEEPSLTVVATEGSEFLLFDLA